MDSRPIGYTIHRWTAFDCSNATAVTLSRLYRALDNSYSNQENCQSEYQRERFRTLRHHFTPQIISSPQEELVCLTFSVRNVSHRKRILHRYIKHLSRVLWNNQISCKKPSFRVTRYELTFCFATTKFQFSELF